ncbi:MAG: hypothetical protein QGH82_00285, partial [Candidatus Woesearchaeota archaeon]|nr:hypothetical protein [Candidatus Woesearchaeota archaeon]
MTKLRMLFVSMYVTNVIRILQLLFPLKLLMLFMRKFVSNKNKKANAGQRLPQLLSRKNAECGQKVAKHVLYPLSQKENVLL